MGQAVANKTAAGTKENAELRRIVTDVLADAVAQALAKHIVNSVVED